MNCNLCIQPDCVCRLDTKQQGSSENHGEVTADVVHAGIDQVHGRIMAKPWQHHDEEDETGLHNEPRDASTRHPSHQHRVRLSLSVAEGNCAHIP